jgi:hypothetical protein
MIIPEKRLETGKVLKKLRRAIRATFALLCFALLCFALLCFALLCTT